jgi:sec-independent protein translocase protein TatA
MGGLSLWHWLVVIILVMLLFGRGRISDLMGDLGKGMKSFKQGMADEDEEKRQRYDEQRRAEPPRQLSRDGQPIDITPNAPPPAEPSATPPPPASGDEPPRG